MLCENCKHISVKEGAQSKDKEPHICTKFNERLYHMGQYGNRHPDLYSCEECKLLQEVIYYSTMIMARAMYYTDEETIQSDSFDYEFFHDANNNLAEKIDELIYKYKKDKIK